jgi:hypothetical protein
MPRVSFRPILALFLTIIPGLFAKSKVTLKTSDVSVPVGQKIALIGAAEANSGSVWYRYRVRPSGQELSIVRDYSPESYLIWTALKEGTYEIELSSLVRETGEISYTSVNIDLTPRADENGATVSATDHPLVFLYSAPPCSAGSTMNVEFRKADGATSTLTPSLQCDGVTTMNFYLAGLRANSNYTANHRVTTENGIQVAGSLSFDTQEIAVTLAANTVPQSGKGDGTYGVMLQSALYQPNAATDLEGNVIWYYEGDINLLSRPQGGGTFMGIKQPLTAGPEWQALRLFDVSGVTLKETNAGRVNDQLAARGVRSITSFHHEVRQLPNGKFIVLASTEQMMKGVEGDGETDILGDMIIVLDSELQVEWTWDAFDHLDPRSQKATLKETCLPVGGGCPPFYLAPIAHDWLHSNSLQLTPDGNLLLSIRHLDWLVKISYDNGQGSGAILWRLGKGGDFQAISKDDAPWFSHQHDGGFFDNEGNLTVFDNGNIRAATDSNAHSRGQVWKIDENARTATLTVNADLGAYSLALGSAFKMDGGYHFDLGFLFEGTAQVARSVETDESGHIRFSYNSATPLYRTFRLKDLYTAPTY